MKRPQPKPGIALYLRVSSKDKQHPAASFEYQRRGTKVYALSHLSRTFHSPFYAGWVTSTKYNIQRGRIRGQWEPLVSDEEFERGVAILVKHDDNKVRQKRYLYRLSGLLQESWRTTTFARWQAQPRKVAIAATATTRPSPSPTESTGGYPVTRSTPRYRNG